MIRSISPREGEGPPPHNLSLPPLIRSKVTLTSPTPPGAIYSDPIMPAGRPSKFSPEIQEKLCEALSGGNYREVAVKYAGIGLRTFNTWMKLGKEEPDGPFGPFRLAVLEAEQGAEVRAVAQVIKTGVEDPKHLQWWLERKFPERWGRDTLKLREMERALTELEKTVNGLKRGVQTPDTPATEGEAD